LIVGGTSSGGAYIKDSNKETLTVDGSYSGTDGTFSLSSAAQTLNVNNLRFSNVTISDTFATAGKVASITLNADNGATNQIGDGTGTVKITAALASINEGTSITIPVIYAKTAVLTSTGGSVDLSATDSINVSNLTASAVKGQVEIDDSSSSLVALAAGSALTGYDVTAAGSLSVIGAISGATINLDSVGGSLSIGANVGTAKTSSVMLTSDYDMFSVSSKDLVSGVNLSLTSNLHSVGTLSNPVYTKASGIITVSAATDSGNYISQTGNASLGASTAPSFSSLTFTDSGTLTVAGAVGFETVNLTATNLTVASGGAISTSFLTVTAPVINFLQGTTTVSDTATFKSASTLTINASNITLGTGLVLGGSVLVGTSYKTTSSITLAGTSNVLSRYLNDTDSALTNITILTSGAFTASLPTPLIALPGASVGGTISIQAASIVDPLNTAAAPVSITANGTNAGGNISFVLTGTQAVALSSAAVPKTATYELSASGPSDGDVTVSTGGALTVAAGGVNISATGADLSLSSSKTLAVTDAALGTTPTTLTLSSGSTTPFTVNGSATVVNGIAGDISVGTLSINAGGGIAINPSGTIVATNASTFSNNTGTLTITGPVNSITPGASLTLTAKSGISLGAAKTGAEDPLANAIAGAGPVADLTINTAGNFSANLPAINNVSLGSGTSVSITAANIVPLYLTPPASIAPIAISSGAVSLVLTGTQAVTLGTATLTKGAPQFEISATADNTDVTVQTGGALTVNSGGITLSASQNALTLSGGKGLSIADNTSTGTAGLLNTNLSSLTLSSGGTTPFVIGGTTVPTNGAVGDISAATVSITDIKGVTLDSQYTIAGTSNSSAAVTFDTSSLLNNGTISGGGTGATLAFSDAGKNNLGVSSLSTGSYSGFGTVTFNTLGSVNLGNLATGTNALLNGVVNTVDVTAGGSLTLSGISVASGGTINLAVGSLVGSSSSAIAFSAPTGAIYVTDKAALIVGGAKSNIAITETTAPDQLVLNSSGILTVNSALNSGNLTLNGSSVVVSKAVTASSELTVLASGKTGTITTPTGGLLDTGNSGQLFIGQTGAALPKAPVLISSTDVLFIGPGAINVSNSTAATNSVIIGMAPFSTASAISYTGTTTANTSISNLTSTAGAINVSTAGNLTVLAVAPTSATGGGITLTAGTAGPASLTLVMDSNLSAINGSISLIDKNPLATPAGSITIGSNSTIYASGTAKGVGQVSIAIGSVPTTGLVAGTSPTPDAPSVHVNGGSGVFYGTTANPTGSIEANGTNTLNAFGRNILFSTGSTSTGPNPDNTIILNGVTITADPPATAAPYIGGTANAVSAAAILPVATATSGSTTVSSVSAPLTSTLTPVNSSVNQSSATLSGISGLNINSSASSSGSLNAVNARAAGLTLNDIDSDNATISNGRLSASSSKTDAGGGKRLTGGVSNVSVKTINSGAELISPVKDTVVKTPFGSISIAAKSAALILVFDRGVAVYNLHDNRKDAVVVQHNSHNINIAPGQNIVLTDRDVRFFEEINPAQRVAYRRMQARNYGDGLKSFRSEFNILSLLQSYEPLKQMVKSTEPEERRMMQSLMKTAAILMSVGGNDQFEYMVAKPLTAYNAAGMTSRQ